MPIKREDYNHLRCITCHVYQNHESSHLDAVKHAIALSKDLDVVVCVWLKIQGKEHGLVLKYDSDPVKEYEEFVKRVEKS